MDQTLLLLGNRYKYIREHLLNKTQQQLAHILNLEQSTISLIENGRIDIIKIINICKIAQISLKDFFDIENLEPTIKSHSIHLVIEKLYNLTPDQLRTLSNFLDSMLVGKKPL